MKYLSFLSLRWSSEEIRKWSSMKRIAYILLPFLLYYVVHDFAEILLWLILDVIAGAGGENLVSTLQAHGGNLKGMVSGLAILAGTCAIYQITFQEIVCAFPSGEQKVKNEKQMLRYALLVLSAVTAATGFNILFYVSGITSSSAGYTETANAQYNMSFVLGLILYGVVSPLAEEALFRGIIYNRMKRCFPVVMAAVLSSFLFGIYHGNVVQALYGTILGILIVLTYELFQSFWMPVLFHAVANISVFAITYAGSLSLEPLRGSLIATGLLLTTAGLFYLQWKLSNNLTIQ